MVLCTAGTRAGDKLAAGLQACSCSNTRTAEDTEAETRGRKRCPKMEDIEKWFFESHEGCTAI